MDTDILLIAIVWILLTFFIFKLAKSKNRHPLGWILVSIITSPLLILIIFAIITNQVLEQKATEKKTYCSDNEVYNEVVLISEQRC